MSRYSLVLLFFAVTFMFSCSEESVVGPISEIENFESFNAKLYVQVYDVEATEKERVICNTSCNTGSSMIGVRDAMVALYLSEQNFLDQLEPIMKLYTDNEGYARFNAISYERYFMYVQSDIGEQSEKINTPNGKVSTISIGL